MKKKLIFFLVISILLFSTFNVKSKDLKSFNDPEISTENKIYGFLIPLNSTHPNEMQINISTLINDLLRQDAEVYWSRTDRDIVSREFNALKIGINHFEKGCYFVAISNDSYKNLEIISILYSYNLNYKIKIFEAREELILLDVYKLQEPKIAIHAGTGSTIQWNAYYVLLKSSGFKNVEFLLWKDIPKKLNNESYGFNVLIWAAWIKGMWNFKESILENIKNTNSIKEIKDFVYRGNGYVGSCYGGIMTSFGNKIPLRFFKSKFILDFLDCYSIIPALPGTGGFTVKIVDSDCPVSYGLPKIIKTKYFHGPMFLMPRKNTYAFGVINDVVEEHWEYDKDIKNNFLKYLKMTLSINRPIWVSAKFGNGTVVSFGDHPEYNYWPVRGITDPSYPYRIAQNAVFYSSSKGPFIINATNFVDINNFNLKVKGPIQGQVLEEIEFDKEIEGAEQPYSLIWRFGDRQNSTDEKPIHRFKIQRPYYIVLSVLKKDNNISTAFLKTDIKDYPENIPPDKPIKVIGTNYIGRGETYQFVTKVNYSFNNSYWLSFDTGEGINLDNYTKDKFYSTQEYCGLIYRWDEIGTYDLKIKAIDENGNESEWSDPLRIEVRKKNNGLSKDIENKGKIQFLSEFFN